MPHYTLKVDEPLDTFTAYGADPAGFLKVNTNDGGYVPYHQVKEYTNRFFSSLSELLNHAKDNGLDITINDDEKSFTLYGQKFYCFCNETEYCAEAGASFKENRYAITPILYKENYVAQPLANIYEGGATKAATVSLAQSTNESGNDAYGYVMSTNNDNGTSPATGYSAYGTYHTNHYYKNFNRYLHDYHLNFTQSTRVGGRQSSSDTTARQYCGPYYIQEYTYANAAGLVQKRVGVGFYADYFGFNQNSSLCASYSTRNTIRYKLNVYHRNDWLYITYSVPQSDNYFVEYPLGFFMKCIDYRNKEVLWTSLTPTDLVSHETLDNAYLTTNNAANNKLYSRVTIWDLETGRDLAEENWRWSQMSKMLTIRKREIQKYLFKLEGTQFIENKIKLVGEIVSTTDEVIAGEEDKTYFTFNRGSCYTINGKLYYIPVDAGLTDLYPDITEHNLVFLRID